MSFDSLVISGFKAEIDTMSSSHGDGFRHQATTDFDEQATFLQGWNQDYAQISAGHFKGFISELHLNDVSFFWEFTSQSLYQQGHLDSDTIAIGIPLNHIGNGMFCGSACEQYALHIYSGNNGFEFVSPQNLMIGLIVISRHRLMQLLSADDQYFLNLQCRRAHIVRVPFHVYFGLADFLKSIFGILRSHPKAIEAQHFKDEVVASAIQLVTESLLCKDLPFDDTLSHKSWRVLANTRELINARHDNPMSVAELCQSLAISRRSLQYHFEYALNTSPIAYLRAERLNGVRQMLKTANSVTEAATYWGFWHFGHFSHEYKKMFGELPSVTFKRFHSPTDG